MIDYLELAQNFIDSDRPIPDEVLLLMNTHERQLSARMVEIKNRLKEDIDKSLPERRLHILKHSETAKRKYRPNFKFLYAAAAMLIALSYFPINQSIETKILLKEETSRFVDQLFMEDEENYLFADLGITEDWFDNSILPEL